MDVLERDESEVSRRIYPSFEAGAAPAHRFGSCGASGRLPWCHLLTPTTEGGASYVPLYVPY